MHTVILPMYIGEAFKICLCPTFLNLFAAFTLISLHVVVWSIHVRGTEASSAPVPMPMLPDVGKCSNTLGCMIV